MHSKFIQISTLVTNDGALVLYALDDQGHIYEKLVGVSDSPWTEIS